MVSAPPRRGGPFCAVFGYLNLHQLAPHIWSPYARPTVSYYPGKLTTLRGQHKNEGGTVGRGTLGAQKATGPLGYCTSQSGREPFLSVLCMFCGKKAFINFAKTGQNAKEKDSKKNNN